MADIVNAALAQPNPVVIFSKSWCPYCTQVKDLFASLPLKPTALYVVEVDGTPTEAEVQNHLAALTGARSVPRVFIGGKAVGGCDDTKAAHRSGALIKLLEGAGALPGAEAPAGGDMKAMDIVLENLPHNPMNSIAFQLKKALGLAATPTLQKIGTDNALCFAGNPADTLKIVNSKTARVYNVDVRIVIGAGVATAAASKAAEEEAAAAEAAASVPFKVDFGFGGGGDDTSSCSVGGG